MHTPALHAALLKHLLSLPHAVPSAAGGWEQVPLAGSQVPTLWQPSWTAQVTAVPALQTPPRQLSMPLHLLPSSQLTPSASAGFEQTPVDGLHVPIP